MKPTDTAREELATTTPAFNMDEIFHAACRAVEEALVRHKALGQSVVVWQDGKVVTIEPEDIPV